jgi:hypothetical protein
MSKGVSVAEITFDGKWDTTTPYNGFHENVESCINTHAKLIAEFIEL